MTAIRHPFLLLSLAALTLLAAGLGLFACSRPETVVVGVYFPREGSASPTALNMHECTLWALDYFNEVQGSYRFEPLISSKASPDAALADMMEKGVEVVFGGASSSQAGELFAVTGQAGIPLITPASSAASLARPRDLLYRGVHDSYAPGYLAGSIALKEGLSGYVLFTATDNDLYGHSYREGFIAGAGGMRPVLTIDVDGAVTDRMLAPVLDEKRSFDTAVLVLPDRWACLAVHQLRLFFPGLKIWMADWGSSPSVAGFDETLMEGVRQAGLYRVDLHSLSHPYMDFIDRHFGPDWDPFALDLTYRAVSFLLSGLQIRSRSGVGLPAALEAVKEVEGLYGTLPVNDNGDVVGSPRVAEIRRGKWTDVTGEVLP